MILRGLGASIPPWRSGKGCLWSEGKKWKTHPAEVRIIRQKSEQRTDHFGWSSQSMRKTEGQGWKDRSRPARGESQICSNGDPLKSPE